MELPLAEIPERALFAPGLVGHLIAYSPDVVVLEDLSGLANSLYAVLYCRLFARPYLIWGLGSVPGKQQSRLRWLLAPLINFFYSGASGFICYSNHAREVYTKYGKPLFVAPNAFLPRLDVQQIQAIQRSIEIRYRENILRLTSIGVFKQQKRFDVLLQAISKLSDLNLELHLIGDGPSREVLERQCADLGLQNRVFFHGALYKKEEKAQLLLKSHLGIMPGRGGLAIQELMSHGVPVISGVADGTERDLIRDGCNGYLIDGPPSADELADRVRQFGKLTMKRKQEWAFDAIETVQNIANVEIMARAVVGAIDGTSYKHRQITGPTRVAVP
jgi:glycosyltransferase involved in cell wall biosynthesis